MSAFSNDPERQLRPVWSVPYFAFHLVPFIAIWTGVNTVDFVVCAVLYFSRMFFINGGYHRYFAHRTYSVGRFTQFVLAVGGASAMQKGPLWFAGHHRLHHRHSDTDLDTHSPRHGFWWSHWIWFLTRRYYPTPYHVIRDFAKFPELRWLDRFHFVPGLLLALACYIIGGLSCVVVGFALSTILCYHAIYCVNSVTHQIGSRRFETPDNSRNVPVVAIATLGEGWHNNHHRFPGSARMGFYWWEIDVCYYILVILGWIGIVHNLRTASPEVIAKALEETDARRSLSQSVST